MPISIHAYGAYGDHGNEVMQACSAFAGLRADADARLYLLGSRPYSPYLRRFLAADQVSPFDAGGINRYAYCGGDPVGRLDPVGQNWFEWLASTLERMQFAVSTVRHASDADVSFATPTLSAMTSASLEGAVIRHALVNGTPGEKVGALRAYGDASVHITGPGAVSTRLIKVGTHPMGIVWPHKGRTASATIFTADQRTIQVTQGPHAFNHDPLRAPSAATGRVIPEWTQYSNRQGGVHFAATTPVRPDDLGPLKAHIDAHYPGRPVTLLAGAHGVMHGGVWNGAEKRLHMEPRFFHRTAMKKHELGWRASMLNYSQIDIHQFRSLLDEDRNIVIHFTCYGVVDDVFMDKFGIRDISVRSLDPVPDLSGRV